MKKHYRRKWSKKRNYPHSQYFLKNCNSLPRPIEPKDAKQILKKIRGKDRIVYFSNDTYKAIQDYLKVRPSTRVQRLFLVEKGLYKGQPISLRGIQKRIEYYAKKTGLVVSCHRLRHTMATQLLNADAMLASVQELLGHNNIVSTQRYCKVSNEKVRRDYFKAMALVMKRNADF